MIERKIVGKYINQYLNGILEEVSPITFYEELFDLANLQEKGIYNDGRYNAMLTNTTKKMNRIVTRDLEILEEAFESETDEYIIRPISYAGRRPRKELARELYAIVIDLDGIIVEKNGFPLGIDAFIDLCEKGILPLPTFIASSGSGVHLYYVLESPIKLFLNTNGYNQLCKLRNALIRKIWDKPVTHFYKEQDIQYESIWQGFRVVGSLTKYGTRARAFRIGDRVSVEYLNKFVMPENQLTDFTYRKKYTLEEAKEKFPEWYEKVVIRGEKGRNTFVLARRVYDHFKERIRIEGRSGHRYYCLLSLVAFGVKCDIPYSEIKKDAYELKEILDSRTIDESNHLTDKDVEDALSAYKDKDRLIRMTKKTICKNTGIELKTAKRNYRKQKEHLEIARMIQEKENPNWRNKEGRPVRALEVYNWRNDNPDGNKSQCARELNMSRNTVSKWWNIRVYLKPQNMKLNPTVTLTSKKLKLLGNKKIDTQRISGKVTVKMDEESVKKVKFKFNDTDRKAFKEMFELKIKDEDK